MHSSPLNSIWNCKIKISATRTAWKRTKPQYFCFPLFKFRIKKGNSISNRHPNIWNQYSASDYKSFTKNEWAYCDYLFSNLSITHNSYGQRVDCERSFSALREDAVGTLASLTITRIYALVQFCLTYNCSKTLIQFITSKNLVC